MRHRYPELIAGVIVTLLLIELVPNVNADNNPTNGQTNLSANLEWNRTWDTHLQEIAVSGDISTNGPIILIDTFNDTTWTTEYVATVHYDTIGKFIWNNTWRNVINDIAAPTSLKVDKNNNFWIVGGINGTTGNTSDAFILEYNGTGNFVNKKIYNFNNQDFFSELCIDNNSIYTIGATNGTTSGWTQEGILIKMDMDGNIINKTILRIGENTIFTSIIVNNGFVYVAGYTNITHPDIIIMKFDLDGKLIWNKIWDSGNSDWANSITIDKNGVIYVGGKSDGNSILLEYNLAGAFLTSQILGTGDYTYVKIDSNGNILIGWTSNTLWPPSISLKALDTPGTELWTTSWKDTGYMVQITDIIPSNNGSFYVTGSEGKLMSAERAIILKYSQNTVPEFVTMILPLTITIALFVVILRKIKRRDSEMPRSL